MFGIREKTITEEEKLQWDARIGELLEEKDYAAAYKKVKEYEKCSKAAAAFFLARLNLMGEGVRQDLDKARIYIEAYVKKYPQDPEGYFLGSSIFLGAGDRQKATAWLYEAEARGKKGLDRYIAEYCSLQGMSYYNTACLTLHKAQRASFNKTAESYFTDANLRYEKIRTGEADCGDTGNAMTENDWTQYGYNFQYMQYIALNGQEEAKAGLIEDQAEPVLLAMTEQGYGVRACYTRAMFAENRANLTGSKASLDEAKQYLDQATALSGSLEEQYRDEYELVWKEYDRIRAMLEPSEKKGLFGKRK